MGISVIFTTIDFHLWALISYHHHRFSSMGISVISPPWIFILGLSRLSPPWIGIYGLFLLCHHRRSSPMGFLAQRLEFSFLVWLPEPLFFSVQHLESVLSFRVIAPDVHIHWHCILPSWLCIRPRLSSLRYPVLIVYSSRTPGWFDRYSFLTWSFESFLEIPQREPGSLVQLRRHLRHYLSFQDQSLCVRLLA